MTATLPTQEQVDLIARDLAPDIVRIRLEVGHDWMERPALFFRVIVSDEAGRERLMDASRMVRRRIAEELRLEDSEHVAYFNFRGKSEQDELQEPAWA